MTRPGAGRFVTFEGGEGAGKSTQVRHLAARLAQHGFPTIATREPGGSPGAEAVRGVLLGEGSPRFGPLPQALLFGAARADHLDRLVRPALRRGEWVICDRFADSTRAYQGAAGGVDLATIDLLERLVVGTTRPDLTVMLDLPPELGLTRAATRRGTEAADAFESEALSFHARLRDAFLAIAAAEPRRCVVVDARAPEDAIATHVWQVVGERLLSSRDARA